MKYRLPRPKEESLTMSVSHSFPNFDGPHHGLNCLTDSSNSDSESTNSSNDNNSPDIFETDALINLVFLSEIVLKILCPMHTSILQGVDGVGELLRDQPQRIINNLRVDKATFTSLSDLLVERQYLKESKTSKVGVRESLAIFLLTVAQQSQHRPTFERFQHSLETISRHVKRVIMALNKLAPEIIVPPDFNVIPDRILYNQQFNPFFKDCVGAIDGTLVQAHVPRWEGSTNDAHVLMDSLTSDSNFPWSLEGKYYLVDSGYCNFPHFLSLYRQYRYYIPEFQGHHSMARGPAELFNKRHSQLCSVIESTFGVVQARFPILEGQSQYIH